MNTVKIILLACALSGAAAAQTENVSPPQTGPSAFQEARENYVSAALVQVQAYRKQIDAALQAAPAEQARYTEPNRLLKELELLVSRLRSAAPSEFDAVKATYERTRTALDRSLGRD